MGWEDQGRQYHMWFGHGTGPGGKAVASGDGVFGPGHLGDRALAAVHGSLGALPRAMRAQGGTALGPDTVERLQGLLARWSGAPRLGDAAFADRFFGRHADDPAVRALRSAAQEVAGARDYGDLRRASEQVATAMQVVGIGNLGRFLADAQARADDPATLAAVAASQPRPASPARPAVAVPAATKPAPASAPAPVDPAPPAAPTPAVAAEPEHGAIWQWLHGLGLVETRHEQAVGLCRVMGSQSGLIYRHDGVPLDVDHMSDDDVLALDKETRGQSLVPLTALAAVTKLTRWGWKGQKPYEDAVDQLNQAGTHRTLNGRVPTREEAITMIEEAGNRVDRVEEGHHPDGNSTHTEPHINYTIIRKRPLTDEKATVIVKSWK